MSVCRQDGYVHRRMRGIKQLQPLSLLPSLVLTPGATNCSYDATSTQLYSPDHIFPITHARKSYLFFLMYLFSIRSCSLTRWLSIPIPQRSNMPLLSFALSLLLSVACLSRCVLGPGSLLVIQWPAMTVCYLLTIFLLGYVTLTRHRCCNSHFGQYIHLQA